MAESFKEKAEQGGHKIAESATKVGHQIGETVEEAADWAKEKAHEVGNRIAESAQKVEHKAKETFGEHRAGSRGDIREHMDVYSSCGTRVGRVDHVEGDRIKLTRSDAPDGQHHTIPLSWVAEVDDGIRLDRDHEEVQRQWQSA